MCEDTCDTAALVVSELVTNAIVHTASDVVVCELHDGDDLVRIAVRDQGCSPDEPHPSPQRPEEEHGRGLLLVEALCHAWGAQEHGLGLLVWADLLRKADAPRDPAEPCNDLGVTPAVDAHHLADAHHGGLAELLDTLDEFPGGSSEPHGDPDEPRNDLGWGARPKPGPVDGSDDDNERPEQRHGGDAHHPAVPRPHASASASPSTPADRPLPRVAPQWHRTADHQGSDDRGGWTPGHPARALPLGYGRERGRI